VMILAWSQVAILVKERIQIWQSSLCALSAKMIISWSKEREISQNVHLVVNGASHAKYAILRQDAKTAETNIGVWEAFVLRPGSEELTF